MLVVQTPTVQQYRVAYGLVLLARAEAIERLLRTEPTAELAHLWVEVNRLIAAAERAGHLVFDESF